MIAASERHLLAMKTLAARRRDVQDLRTLVRRLELASPDEVIEVVAQVFPDEPVPGRARLVLDEVFAE